MPLRRDADGNIINERTSLIRQPRVNPGGDDKTVGSRTQRKADVARPTDERSSADTKPVPGRKVDQAARQTQIYRPARPGEGTGDDTGSTGRNAPAADARDGVPTVPVAGRADPPAKSVRGRRVDQAADDPMDDPPVGWLVIIDGPGKGRVVTLGMGYNSIGRDQTARVSLDYGDAMISRTNHGAITYDPRSRKFYVQHGDGTNLTYANDEPVLAPRELEPSTHLQLGKTVLRFVPLCGVGFSWEDETEGD